MTPAVNVYLPKDRVTSQHQGYGFVEFKSEEDADYVRQIACSYIIRVNPPCFKPIAAQPFCKVETAFASVKYACCTADAGHKMQGARY